MRCAFPTSQCNYFANGKEPYAKTSSQIRTPYKVLTAYLPTEQTPIPSLHANLELSIPSIWNLIDIFSNCNDTRLALFAAAPCQRWLVTFYWS